MCVCKLGNLYNQDEIISRLVNKNMPKEGFQHIQKLKDVQEIALIENENYTLSKEDEEVYIKKNDAANQATVVKETDNLSDSNDSESSKLAD